MLYNVEMNYLKFLNEPTFENIEKVNGSVTLSHEILAEMIGISVQTYRAWIAPVGSPSRRIPSIPAWNLLLYELQARKLNYANVKHLLDYQMQLKKIAQNE